jgi:hypothetical protein
MIVHRPSSALRCTRTLVALGMRVDTLDAEREQLAPPRQVLMASAGAVVTAGGCECSASECFATPRGRCSPAVSGPPFPSRSSPEILWLGAWAARHATVLEPTSVVLTFVVGCGLVLCDAVLFTAALAACSVGRQRAHHGGSVVSLRAPPSPSPPPPAASA